MLLELVKFEHSVFALPYAYIGAVYGAAHTAAAWPPVAALGWITVVMVGARAFAFVVNRAVDKEIDARNPRTAGRAVPAGLIKAGELWAFAAVMLAAYLAGVWQLDPIVRVLWPIPLVAFIAYPYMKRFTWACHYWLGLCLGLAPVGGWVALGAPIAHPAPWLFGLAVMVWTAGFDIIYATMDYECDVRDGVHSAPANLGIRKALLMTRALHVLTVVVFVGAGVMVGAGWPYFGAVAVAAVLLAYENSIVSAKDLSRVDAAFFTFNGVIAMVIFAGVLVDRLIA
ncbi:MAG: putative 4-hydroxybenzoate polyprenyltransferase [Clostridiales bacterium]|nr:putative 4-hydroxybenzoate polyprenyltransferase [Clostridiales bacterium]